MDRVLANFDKSWLEDKLRNPDVEYPQSAPGFFAKLEPIEGAVKGYRWLDEHFDTQILTRPSVMNPHCYTDKRLWTEQHLGMEVVKKLHISTDKGLFRGDYLIDDMPWPGFEGEQVVFGSEQFPGWPEVVKYFATKYKIVGHGDK